MYRPSTIRVLLSGAALLLVVGACGSGDDGETSAQIRQFCSSFATTAAFACCQPADTNEPSFAARYRFVNSSQCASFLSAQESSASGRQAFDASAAQSCLAHLNGRQCGGPVTKEVLRAEQEAGCYRVLTGKAAEGQQCTSSDDCALGLVCPPVRETGLAFCAKPATLNQVCYGQQADSIDHPACDPGLICSFIEQTSVCPSPPCLTFKCVPPFESGDPCNGTECAKGLVCKDGSCQAGEPNGAGGKCRILEHCATGLYCDTASETCGQRKNEGDSCTVGNNALYECKGICKGAGDSGTCAAFCGQ